MEYEVIDYEIMDYVSKHNPIFKDDLEKHFHNLASFSYRLDRLTYPLPYDDTTINPAFKRFMIKENVLVEDSGMIHISDYGQVMLQDYKTIKAIQEKRVKDENKRHNRLFWLALISAICGVAQLLREVIIFK